MSVLEQPSLTTVWNAQALAPVSSSTKIWIVPMFVEAPLPLIRVESANYLVRREGLLRIVIVLACVLEMQEWTCVVFATAEPPTSAQILP